MIDLSYNGWQILEALYKETQGVKRPAEIRAVRLRANRVRAEKDNPLISESGMTNIIDALVRHGFVERVSRNSIRACQTLLEFRVMMLRFNISTFCENNDVLFFEVLHRTLDAEHRAALQKYLHEH